MDLKEIEIKKEKETQDTGRFTIGPLPSGYGVTLGTALRRILLSSLPGGAISEVRFQGIPHPFGTIKGIKEDVVEILLNLKKVRFKLHGNGPYEGEIHGKGKKVVTAGDIKISSEASVVNPPLKIATLTDRDAELSATLNVERGFGYKPAEEREGGKVGVIPMDSIFSPVLRVGFWVKGARVGRKADLDQIILEVVTDGTIKPSEAVLEAAKVLRDYFDHLTGWKSRPKKEAAVAEKPLLGSESDTRKLEIAELNLPPRVTNILEEAGVRTVGGLAQKTEEDLLNLKGFGETGLAVLKKELRKLSVSLKE